MIHRAIALIGVLAAFVCAANAASSTAPATAATRTAATSRPATTKSVAAARAVQRKGPSDAGRAAVRAAVEKLSREYQEYLKKPTAPLRTACNYFKENPSADVTADAVLPVLLSPAGDARVAAYVRWQLLSALPDKLDGGDDDDEATAKELLKAYRQSPAPLTRPGASPADQRKLDQIVQGRKAGQETDVAPLLDQPVAQNLRDNGPIVAYRDELYRRLPKGPETFAAALEDGMQRLGAVAEAKDLVKALTADVRAWVVTEAPPPATMLQLARAARKLADTRGPQYYVAPQWRESSGVMAWRKSRSTIDSAGALKDLAVFLEEQAQSAAAAPPSEAEKKAR